MRRAAAERILSADVIAPERLPSYAGRVCETYIKRKMFAYEDKAVRRLWSMYRTAFAEMRDAAYSIEPRNGEGRSIRKPLLDRWRLIIRRLSRKVITGSAQAALGAYYAGYYGRAWLLDSMTAEDVQVQISVPDISRALNLTFREADNDDELWAYLAQELGEDWWMAYSAEFDELLVKLTRALNRGIREGKGMADIMDYVAEAMGLLDETSYRANFGKVQTITRTYVMNASNQGAAQLYRENEHLLSGMQHLTARDERVCQQCRGLDGFVYAFDAWEVPPMNTHPNCRCTIVPLVRDDYGLPTIDMPPAETMTEWLNKQGVAQVLADWLSAGITSERVG